MGSQVTNLNLFTPKKLQVPTQNFTSNFKRKQTKFGSQQQEPTLMKNFEKIKNSPKKKRKRKKRNAKSKPRKLKKQINQMKSKQLLT